MWKYLIVLCMATDFEGVPENKCFRFLGILNVCRNILCRLISNADGLSSFSTELFFIQI